MSDRELLIERLDAVLKALERVPRRFEEISCPDDFLANEACVD